jgi:hypothetical protein
LAINDFKDVLGKIAFQYTKALAAEQIRSASCGPAPGKEAKSGGPSRSTEEDDRRDGRRRKGSLILTRNSFWQGRYANANFHGPTQCSERDR